MTNTEPSDSKPLLGVDRNQPVPAESKIDQVLRDLPISPYDLLLGKETDGTIAPVQEVEIPYDDFKRMGADNFFFRLSGIAKLRKSDTVLSTTGVPDAVTSAVALAVKLAPLEIINHFPDGFPHAPTLVIIDGELRNKAGLRFPATVDIDSNRSPDEFLIKMSLVNTRLSFGLNQSSETALDPIILFAAAVHEICDWMFINQYGYKAHTGLMDNSGEPLNEAALAKQHSDSAEEQFSNRIATKLTEEVFGVTVTFGENSETLFTPEP